MVMILMNIMIMVIMIIMMIVKIMIMTMILMTGGESYSLRPCSGLSRKIM